MNLLDGLKWILFQRTTRKIGRELYRRVREDPEEEERAREMLAYLRTQYSDEYLRGVFDDPHDPFDRLNLEWLNEKEEIECQIKRRCSD